MLRLAARFGVAITQWGVPVHRAATADEVLEAVSRRIRPGAIKVVFFSSPLWPKGQRMPERRIAALAQEAGAITVVDGAHYGGMIEPKLDETGIDFWAISGHKWQCGPGGTGSSEDWVMDSFGCDPLGGHAMLATAENVARKHGLSTAEQHEVVLAREAQFAAALADDSAFLKRFMTLPFAVPAPGYKKRVSLIPLTFGVVFARCLIHRRGRFLTYFVVLPLVLMLGLISGSKATFLGPLLGILVSVHYLRRQVRLKGIVLFALLVIALFPLFNLYRQVGTIDRMAEAVDQLPSVLLGDELEIDEAGLLLLRSSLSRFLGIDSLTYIIRDTPHVMDFQ